MSKTEIVQLPKTFAESLRRIDLAKERSRNAFYDLLATVYAAYSTGFKDKSGNELDENTKLLNDKCKPESIDVDKHDIYQKLAMLALGGKSKAIYNVVHVVKVAEKHSVKVADFVKWLTDERGVQNVRITYKSDGSKRGQSKKQSSKSTAPTKAEIAEDLKRLAQSARETLQRKQHYLLPLDAELPVIAKLGEEVDCTAIMRQLADGSFVIKTLVIDPDVTELAYAAYARSQNLQAKLTQANALDSEIDKAAEAA